MNRFLNLLLLATQLSFSSRADDTLRVMSYNVLSYGDHCQGSNSTLHGYLKTIVQFTQPDILGLVKVASITTSSQDFHGLSPMGFGDSILNGALNAAFPGRYAYGTLTNVAGANSTDVLFYNTQKLGYLGVRTLVVNVEDFNLHKLYYKDPALATTHDTTFLYVVLNHTASGNSSTDRDVQLTAEVAALKSRLSFLPNLIDMGDFNVHSSAETGYSALAFAGDSLFKLYDPPFSLDASLTYPGNWDASPQFYQPFLTTSTRQSSSIPNTCGTNGGAKSWYDHIFLSRWIRSGANYLSYIPGSYQTIGNDGHRLSISINDNSTYNNTSAPQPVLDALFQMSNKYPIMVQLLVRSNTSGVSPANPVENSLSVGTPNHQNNPPLITSPILNEFRMKLPQEWIGNAVDFSILDMSGRLVAHQNFMAKSSTFTCPSNLSPGIYLVQISYPGSESYRIKVIKN